MMAAAKPRFRGSSHKYAFFVSLATGALLVLLAHSARAAVALAVYAVSVSAMFGASALYHQVDWPATKRRWMRRLDHSMIFLLIAGTYTPFALLVLHGTFATVMLIVVWAGAVGGIVLKLAWIDAPKWLAALCFVALGWVAVAAMPQLASGLGWAGTALLALGGLLYTAGAAIYAFRRPDPAPTVFGYHEVFHVLVILAAAAQYAALLFFVAPR